MYIKANSRLIRPSFGLYKKITLFRNARSKLSALLEREPSIEEIAKEMGETVENTLLIYQNQCDIISTNSKVANNSDTEFEKIIPDKTISVEDMVDKLVLIDDVDRILDEVNISDRAKEMILLNFGLKGRKQMSCAEIARLYGVSRQSVNSLIQKSLLKIKYHYGFDSYSTYMDYPDKIQNEINEYIRAGKKYKIITKNGGKNE